jgi:hypothetical protein
MEEKLIEVSPPAAVTVAIDSKAPAGAAAANDPINPS